MSINPVLTDLEPLLGRWGMEMYNVASMAPGARVTGSIEIDWIEDGSAVAMRQSESENPAAAVWIIGRDDSEADYSVLYADLRGVSRTYRMSLKDTDWQIWRDGSEFYQRFTAQLDPDARTIRGRWEKSADRGGKWEHDFDLLYTKLSPEDAD
jgi:hypothetical protein